MKKIYIRPNIHIEHIHVKPFMITASGVGTMNARKSRFHDMEWEEEEEWELIIDNAQYKY